MPDRELLILTVLGAAVLLLCAAVKVYNGVFLMQQKAFAKKYAPKKGDK